MQQASVEGGEAHAEDRGQVQLGGAGDDLLIGGQGDDVFVFLPGFGADTVAGHGTGDDLIDMTAVGVSDLSDLAFAETEAGLVITAPEGDSLLIDGATLANFDSDTILI